MDMHYKATEAHKPEQVWRVILSFGVSGLVCFWIEPYSLTNVKYRILKVCCMNRDFWTF